jgi:ubiquitin carboxyl-terminal hydrolase 1
VGSWEKAKFGSMNSRQDGFDTFYDDQVAARRQFYAREHAVNRTNDVAVFLTVAALLVTFLFRYIGPDGSLEGAFSSIGNFLWDALVFIIPAPLLFAIDSWMNSTATPPMHDTLNQSKHAAKSEALRRVMGLDRQDGVMSSVLRARTRALSMTGSVLGLKIDSDRPAGLGNRDNSCYQNSVLQGLASLHSMPDYLAACLKDAEEFGDGMDKNVANTLRSLIADLNDVSNNGKTLWTPSVLKSMNTWTQQDAQEYYSKVLDDIEKGAALVAKNLASATPLVGLEGGDSIGRDGYSTSEHSDDSGYQSQLSSSRADSKKAVRNPLEGLLAQRVACVQCGYSDGLSMIPFNCLTLSLGLDKNHHDLYERLDSYSKVEEIEGVECPKCTLLKAQRLLTKLVERLESGGSKEGQLAEPLRRLEAVKTALEEDDFAEETIKDRCKITAQSRVNVTKTKQMVIARPPQSLAIHVNRSVFDPSTFNMIKNSAPVNFPMTLDLGPWCLGSAEKLKSASEKNAGDDEEEWQLHPMSSMIAGDLGESRLTGPIYELRAVVTHYGRHENGHYICYRKYPPSNPDDLDNVDEKHAIPPKETTDGVDDDAAGPNAEEEAKSSSHGDRDSSWWRLSDQNVSQVNEDTVMSLSPGVFMLFYECVDPSMILSSELKEKVTELTNVMAEATITRQDESEVDDATALTPATTITPDVIEAELKSASEDILANRGPSIQV